MNTDFTDSSSALPIACFLAFMAFLLFLAMLTSPDLRSDADGLYTQSSPGPLRGGLALTGDFVSGAGVLYLCGIVAVAGQDGVLIIAGTALSPVLLKVWLADKLPEGKGWSLGDVLARTVATGPARRAACVAALTVTVPLLVAQMIPIGQITATLMQLPGDTGEMAGILLVGVLMVACSAIGGVRGSTLLQVVKTVSFLLLAPLLALLVLAQFHWNYGEVLAHAERASHAGAAYLTPGRLFGTGFTGRMDTLSLGLTVLFGTAFLPYMITRLTTSSTAKAARRTVSWAVGAICLLCASAVIIGYGIMALVGARNLGAQGPRGGNNLLLLASALDGSDPRKPGMLLTFICCAAFLTVLASASVMLLTGSAAFVHDLGRSGRATVAAEDAGEQPPRGAGGVWARLALIGVGAACIVIAIAGRSANAQFWLTLSYTEAASVVLPALAYALLWRRFAARGLRWCVYGGTVVTVGLLALSPAVSGAPGALYPSADWHLIPLHAPGIFSIPAGFLLGWLGNAGARTEIQPAPSGTSAPQGERVAAY